MKTVRRKNFYNELLQQQLYLLHAATGHSSTRNMFVALQKRGAPKEVIEAAKQFRCSVCEETGKLKPRPVASLEPLPYVLMVVTGLTQKIMGRLVLWRS